MDFNFDDGIDGFDRSQSIDRTLTGLQITIVGLLLLWIPYITYLGALLFSICTIFIILGRKAFRRNHELMVFTSITLFVAQFIGVLILESRVPETISGVHSASAFITLVNDYFIFGVIVGAVQGLSLILLVLGLSNRLGYVFLILAFVSNMVISAALFIYIEPSVSSAVAQAFATGNMGPLQNVLYRMDLKKLAVVVSLMLYAVAYYLAYRRIKRKEIPAL